MVLITTCHVKSEERINELLKLFKTNPEIFGSQFKNDISKYETYIRQEFNSNTYHSIDKITEEIKALDPPIFNGQINTRLVEVDIFGKILETIKIYGVE